MSTLITSGIQISVQTQFRPDLSNIVKSEFLFNYRIDIENTNPFSVQLMTRDWYIFDSLYTARYVNGKVLLANGLSLNQANVIPIQVVVIYVLKLE